MANTLLPLDGPSRAAASGARRVIAAVTHVWRWRSADWTFPVIAPGAPLPALASHQLLSLAKFRGDFARQLGPTVECVSPFVAFRGYPLEVVRR